MANAVKLFNQMRRNPRDWRIADLCVVANRFGIVVVQGKGSHVKFHHPATRTYVVVPDRRPIKEVYVRLLLRLINEVANAP